MSVEILNDKLVVVFNVNQSFINNGYIYNITEFPFLEPQFIHVSLRKLSKPDSLVPLIYNQDFSVHKNEDFVSGIYGFVQILSPFVLLGDRLVIFRSTDISQLIEFDEKNLIGSSLDYSSDKITQIAQELSSNSNYIKLPIDLDNLNKIDLTIPAYSINDLKDKYLQINSNGTALILSSGFSQDLIRAIRIPNYEDPSLFNLILPPFNERAGKTVQFGLGGELLLTDIGDLASLKELIEQLQDDFSLTLKRDPSIGYDNSWTITPTNLPSFINKALGIDSDGHLIPYEAPPSGASSIIVGNNFTQLMQDDRSLTVPFVTSKDNKSKYVIDLRNHDFNKIFYVDEIVFINLPSLGNEYSANLRFKITLNLNSVYYLNIIWSNGGLDRSVISLEKVVNDQIVDYKYIYETPAGFINESKNIFDFYIEVSSFLVKLRFASINKLFSVTYLYQEDPLNLNSILAIADIIQLSPQAGVISPPLPSSAIEISNPGLLDVKIGSGLEKDLNTGLISVSNPAKQLIAGDNILLNPVTDDSITINALIPDIEPSGADKIAVGDNPITFMDDNRTLSVPLLNNFSNRIISIKSIGLENFYFINNTVIEIEFSFDKIQNPPVAFGRIVWQIIFGTDISNCSIVMRWENMPNTGYFFEYTVFGFNGSNVPLWNYQEGPKPSMVSSDGRISWQKDFKPNVGKLTIDSGTGRNFLRNHIQSNTSNISFNDLPDFYTRVSSGSAGVISPPLPSSAIEISNPGLLDVKVGSGLIKDPNTGTISVNASEQGGATSILVGNNFPSFLNEDGSLSVNFISDTKYLFLNLSDFPLNKKIFMVDFELLFNSFFIESGEPESLLSYEINIYYQESEAKIIIFYNIDSNNKYISKITLVGFDGIIYTIHDSELGIEWNNFTTPDGSFTSMVLRINCNLSKYFYITLKKVNNLFIVTSEIQIYYIVPRQAGVIPLPTLESGLAYNDNDGLLVKLQGNGGLTNTWQGLRINKPLNGYFNESVTYRSVNDCFDLKVNPNSLLEINPMNGNVSTKVFSVEYSSSHEDEIKKSLTEINNEIPFFFVGNFVIYYPPFPYFINSSTTTFVGWRMCLATSNTEILSFNFTNNSSGISKSGSGSFQVLNSSKDGYVNDSQTTWYRWTKQPNGSGYLSVLLDANTKYKFIAGGWGNLIEGFDNIPDIKIFFQKDTVYNTNITFDPMQAIINDNESVKLKLGNQLEIDSMGRLGLVFSLTDKMQWLHDKLIALSSTLNQPFSTDDDPWNFPQNED